MNLIQFEEQNVIIAKDQPGYRPMPAHVVYNEQGEVICCWKLTWRERWKIFFTGIMWQSMWTFDGSIQPQKLTVEKPEMKETVR